MPSKLPEPEPEPAPEPGYPTVERILPGENSYRWTFATDDRATQDEEFVYWMGWFGFEEDDEPDRVEGKVWYIRRHS